MKLYIDKNTGGIYKLSEESNVEMCEAVGLLDTENEEQWYQINPWDEDILFEGVLLKPMEFEKIIYEKLTKTN